ncbi:zinc-binding dehydrogenase [Oerskovia flava]|uniref:zinc-binding dehydrogenase n=1 Tax=Oerskovia flava TaxID=2986422 RepID=UPI00223EF2F6|nr:zinc-binding dehydrogenase [Oerskovia sp. JB1-3-2]
MDAIRLHEFGPPENLVLEEVPDPVAGPGQVRVRVRAHGVHLLDTSLRRGETGGPLALPSLPTVPGREVAGAVDAVGPGVDAAWLGRRVAAHLGAVASGGGYARCAVVPVESLHRIPDHVRAPEAIAMIGTGRTALGVLGLAAIGPEDVVVVLAAAGGLGSLFVQSAVAAGAQVLALAGGPEKVALVRSLIPGAGSPDDLLTVVDYRAPGWVTRARAVAGRATVVLDGVGGELGAHAADLLRPGGRLVVHGWASGEANPRASEEAEVPYDVVHAVGPAAPPWGDLYALQERALALVADGAWRVLVHLVPFAEAARAHRELEERATTGKVVLV